MCSLYASLICPWSVSARTLHRTLVIDKMFRRMPELGWVDDDGSGWATSRIKRVRKGVDNPGVTHHAPL